MHEIVDKERLNEEMTRIEIKAPLVAEKIKPGQYGT